MRKLLVSTRIVSPAILAFVFAIAGAVSVSAGAKDKPLSKAEAKKLIANAETKADHERIAVYFDGEAARYAADAKEHSELASFYLDNPDPALSKHPGSPRAFEHCDSLSKSLQKAAEEARKLAAEHRAMASAVKK